MRCGKGNFKIGYLPPFPIIHPSNLVRKHLIDHHLVTSSSPDLPSIVDVVASCVSSDFVSSGLLTVVSSSSTDELRHLDRLLLKSLLHAQRRALFTQHGVGGGGGKRGDANDVGVDDEVVVRALKRDFLLTVDWNQPEIAEKFIFNEFR